MLTDPQLACLAISAGPIVLAALWSLGDVCGRAVGGCATPVPADEAFRAIAGHAVRIAFMAPAALTAALALAFAFSRKVRP